MRQLFFRYFFVLSLPLIVISCDIKDNDIQPDTINKSEPVEDQKEPEIVIITGKVVLGPVISGNNLWVVAYSQSGKELNRVKVKPDGSYELGIKGYKGMLITRVVDEDPETSDFIDEAKRKKVSFGDRQIYSVIFIGSKTDSADNNQRISNFITPLSSLSSYKMGIKFEQDQLIIPSNFKSISTKEIQAKISSENRRVARAFCEEDKDVTFIEPKPIISSDNNIQVGNSCGNALAAISGLESIYATTNEAPLAKIISNLSDSLDRGSEEDQLSKLMQDKMVLGVQRVTKALNPSDNKIFESFSKYQEKFKASDLVVDESSSILPAPIFTNNSKTANLQPIWKWYSMPGSIQKKMYRYRFDSEDDWTETDSNSYSPKSNLEAGEYTLYLQEKNTSGHSSNTAISTIKIFKSNWSLVVIKGNSQQYETLTAEVSDQDAISADIRYQWIRDGSTVDGATKPSYKLTQADVGKKITVAVTYTDKFGEEDMLESASTSSIDNINDRPILLLHLCQNLLADELKLFKCTIEATDADEKTNFTYRLIKSPVGMAIDSKLGKISWTPDNKSTSYFDEEITVEVDDGSGAKNATVSQSFTIRVNAIDDKPIITTSKEPTSVKEDIEYSHNLKINDPDTDTLTVSINAKSQWLKFADNPNNKKVTLTKKNGIFTTRLTGTPLNKHVGENKFTLEIGDDKSKTILESESFGIKVENSNDKGTVKIEGKREQYQSLNAIVKDDDGITFLIRYQWQRDERDIDGATEKSYKLIQADVGKKITVAVTYTDKFGEEDTLKSASTSSIDNINDRPILLLHLCQNLLADELKLFKCTIEATDADEKTNFTYRLIKSPVGMAIDSKLGQISWTPDNKSTSYFDEEITVEVDDGSGAKNATVSQSFTIRVNAIDDKPIITTSKEPPSATEDIEYSHNLKINDPDTDTLTVSINAKSQWLKFADNPNNKKVTLTKKNGIFTTRLTGTPLNKHVGENKFTLEIGDDKSKTILESESFSIKVENSNDKGTVKIEGKREQYQSLNAIVKDDDGITFLIRYQWQRDERDIDGATEKSYKLIQADVGKKITVAVTYTDKFGEEDTLKSASTSSIDNINDRPILLLHLCQNLLADELKLFKCTIEATDADEKTNFTYRLIKSPEGMAIDSKLGKISWTPDNKSTSYFDEEITVEVDDGSGAKNATVSQSFTIRVNAIDDKPIITTSKEPTSVKEDNEYTNILRIEDPDSDVLFLHLDKFPNWLKLNEYYGQGDKVKLYKNTVGHFEAPFRGTPTELFTDDNYDNSVKISIGDRSLATDDNIVTFQPLLNVINVNDNPEPWAGGSDAELVRREEGGTEWDWLLPSNIVAKDSIEFSLNLYEYITFVDVDDDDDTIICGASLHNGEPLPEWLTVSKQKNTPCKTYLFKGTPRGEDLSKPSLKIRVYGYDNSGGVASVFFELPLKNIEYDPIFTGDFTAPVYLKSSYTLTADDLFYHDFDSADSVDKVIFHVSNMQNGYFQNFPHGFYFTGEQLLNGELIWVANNTEAKEASFDVYVIDNSGKRSSIKTFNFDVKKPSPIIKVFDKNEEEVKRGDVYTGKEFTVKIDLLFEPAVFIEYGPWGSWQATFNEFLSDSDHLQFMPEEDITVENASWTRVDTGSSSSRYLTLNLVANDNPYPVTVTIAANQYSWVGNKSIRNAETSFSWNDRSFSLSKVDPYPIEPNTFSWHLLSGGGDYIFLYRVKNWKSNEEFARKLENVRYRKDQWKKNNGDIIDVEVDPVYGETVYVTKTIKNSDQYNFPLDGKHYSMVPQIAYRLTIKGSGQYNIEADESFDGKYYSFRQRRIFIPQINVSTSDNYSLTSNSSIGITKSDRTTQYQSVFLSIDTMVAAESFSEESITVTNGKIVKDTWEKISTASTNTKYKVEINAENKGAVEVTINRKAYKDKYRGEFNEKAKVSWIYKPDYDPLPIIKHEGDVETIKSNGNSSHKKTVSITINVSEYKKNWPVVNWDDSYLSEENIHKQEHTRDCTPRWNPDNCVYTMLIKDQNCSGSEGCKVKVFVNNPDGDNIDSFQWEYTPRSKGNEQQEQKLIDNQLGPAPIIEPYNKSASIDWINQPNDNNQNSKIVTPTITVKDATGKIIGDTTNRSRVTVEIDTIVDTTDFKKHHLLIEGASAFSFKSQGNSKRLYKVNLLTEQPQISLRIKADTYRENQDSQNSTSVCKESKANCKRNAEARIQWTFDPKYNSEEGISIGWDWLPKVNKKEKFYTGIYRYKTKDTNWTETTENSHYPKPSLSDGTHILKVQAQYEFTEILTFPDKLNRAYVATQWDTSDYISIHVENGKIVAPPKNDNKLLEEKYKLDDKNRDYENDKSTILGKAYKLVLQSETKSKLSKSTIQNGELLPPLKVEIQDRDGNIVTSHTEIIVGISIWSWNLHTKETKLSCVTDESSSDCVNAQVFNGIATFENIKIEGKVNDAFTLIFESGSLKTTTHDIKIDKTGKATKLALQDQDGEVLNAKIDLQNGQTLPTLKVELRDSAGNLTDSMAKVKATIICKQGCGIHGRTLAMFYSEDAKDGIATFENIKIEGKVNDAFTLIFESGSLKTTTHDIKIDKTGKATKLALQDQDGEVLNAKIDLQNGQTLPTLKVELRDSAGNLTDSTAKVKATIICNQGCGIHGRTLAMFYSEDAKDGIATFKNIKLEGKVNDTFTLTFESGDIKSTTHDLTINKAGEATKLALQDQDGEVLNAKIDLQNGQTLPTLKVELRDSAGNLTDSTDKVKATIICNQGCGIHGRTLAMFYSEDAKDGIATFKNIKLEGKVDDTFTLTFESGDIKSTTHDLTINKAGEAAKLVLKRQDGSLLEKASQIHLKNGQKLSDINVEIHDTDGKIIKSDSVLKVRVSMIEGADLKFTCESAMNCTVNYNRDFIEVSLDNGKASLKYVSVSVKNEVYKAEPMQDFSLVFSIYDDANDANISEIPPTQLNATFNSAPPKNDNKLLEEKYKLDDKNRDYENDKSTILGKAYKLVLQSETKSKLSKSTIQNGELLPPLKVEIQDRDGNIVTSHTEIIVGISIWSWNLHTKETKLSCVTDESSSDCVNAQVFNGIATFENIKIEGKVNDTFTLIFESGSLKTTTHDIKIDKTGKATKLALQDQDGEVLNAKIDLQNGQTLPTLKVELRDSAGNLTDSTAKVKATIICKQGCVIHGRTLAMFYSEDAKDGIATFKNIKLEGKVDDTFTLTFESGDIKSTTHDLTINKAGEAAKLVLKRQDGSLLEKASQIHLKNGQKLSDINVEIHDTDGKIIKSDSVLKVRVSMIEGADLKFTCESAMNCTVNYNRDFIEVSLDNGKASLKYVSVSVKNEVYKAEPMQDFSLVFSIYDDANDANISEIPPTQLNATFNSAPPKNDNKLLEEKYKLDDKNRDYENDKSTILGKAYKLVLQSETKSKLSKSTIQNGELLPPLKVEIQDRDGNIVTSHTEIIVGISIWSWNLHTKETKLSCVTDESSSDCVNAQVFNGIATFENIKIEGKVNDTFTLIFESGSLKTTTHDIKIDKTGKATKLALQDQDGEVLNAKIDLQNGQTLPTLKVELRDSAGNLTDSTAKVKATIICKQGCVIHGRTLAMFYSEDAKDGIATFKNIKLEGKVDDTFTLTFESGDIKSTTHDLTINKAGEAAKLVLKRQDGSLLEKASQIHLKNGQKLSDINVEIHDTDGKIIKSDSVLKVRVSMIEGADLKFTCESAMNCTVNYNRDFIEVSLDNGKASLKYVSVSVKNEVYKAEPMQDFSLVFSIYDDANDANISEIPPTQLNATFNSAPYLEAFISSIEQGLIINSMFMKMFDIESLTITTSVTKKEGKLYHLLDLSRLIKKLVFIKSKPVGHPLPDVENIRLNLSIKNDNNQLYFYCSNKDNAEDCHNPVNKEVFFNKDGKIHGDDSGVLLIGGKMPNSFEIGINFSDDEKEITLKYEQYIVLNSCNGLKYLPAGNEKNNKIWLKENDHRCEIKFDDKPTNIGKAPNVKLSAGEILKDKFANDDILYGTKEADSLYGAGGNNILWGNGSDDRLYTALKRLNSSINNYKSGDLFCYNTTRDAYNHNSLEGKDTIIGIEIPESPELDGLSLIRSLDILLFNKDWGLDKKNAYWDIVRRNLNRKGNFTCSLKGSVYSLNWGNNSIFRYWRWNPDLDLGVKFEGFNLYYAKSCDFDGFKDKKLFQEVACNKTSVGEGYGVSEESLSFKWNDNLSSVEFNIQDIDSDESMTDGRLVLTTLYSIVAFECIDDSNSRCLTSNKKATVFVKIENGVADLSNVKFVQPENRPIATSDTYILQLYVEGYKSQVREQRIKIGF